MEKEFKLTVFGARGSMPGEGKDYALYGGSTSCYRIDAGTEEIYLDAGSGIAGAKTKSDSNIRILLTHMHLDHLIGIPFFSALGEKNRQVDIYAAPRDGLFAQAALDRLVSLPFWPIKIEEYPASVVFHNLPLLSSKETYRFLLGNVTVDMTEGSHPGGATVFRLTYGGKSVVYATDFEHTTEFDRNRLIIFSQNADILLYDAQYTEEEYEKYRGYGHSTAEAGLKIAKAAQVKRIMFVHHAPWRRDEETTKLERHLQRENNNVFFAKIGDEIIL